MLYILTLLVFVCYNNRENRICLLNNDNKPSEFDDNILVNVIKKKSEEQTTTQSTIIIICNNGRRGRRHDNNRIMMFHRYSNIFLRRSIMTMIITKQHKYQHRRLHSHNNMFCSAWLLSPPSTTTSRTRIQRQQQQQFHTTTLSSLLATPNNKNNDNNDNSITWNVGDNVSINHNGSIQKGEIVSIRGGGWYTVQLVDDKSSIIKCRRSQFVMPSSHSSNDNNNNNNKLIMMLTGENTINKSINQNDTQRETKTTATTRSTTARTILEIDPGRPPDFPPPSPTIHDLDTLLQQSSISSSLSDPLSTQSSEEYMKQIAYHSSYDKWVVFTDLHCSSTTLDTCIEVLDTVHTVALEENAGVLFLGDFWHHRGTLRVDCLNAILKAFESWQVPMIMIPGNHDQVTLGGHDHGLTPLSNAYRVGDDDEIPGPLILSYPTVFRKALFVPHIRDVATMESVLQSQHAQEASALFVHAEVKGALMNDLMISTHGIPPASFPSHKSIYSGHFHKPHSVQSSRHYQNGTDAATTTTTTAIEYLGSPYQVSLAEAEQDKQLAILDANWQCEKRIPLSIGKRHFKTSSLEELTMFQFHDGSTNDSI